MDLISTGTDLRNIFPQSSNFNRGMWAQVEGQVADVVHNNNGAIFIVNLQYANAAATRPDSLVYCIKNLQTNANILTNDILNP